MSPLPTSKKKIRAASAVTLLPMLTGACFLTGCATPSTEAEGWIYVGTDPTLKLPESGYIAKRELEENPSKYRDQFNGWKKRALEDIANTKTHCAVETGDAATRSLWRYYSKKFLACMESRGWTKDRSTNPA
jgi:hypothetical protein